jgi:glycolate oxidase iron-sulfur subunit
MDQALHGEPLSPTMVEHFDRCLGCLACVSACPSGVRYDQLIEATRDQVERHTERSWPDRALRAGIFALFPHPRRLAALRPLLRAYRASGAQRAVRGSRLFGALPAALRTAESLTPELGPTRPLPTFVRARGRRRATVGLLTGCVQGAFFPGVNAATARVLALEGCDVVIPRGQSCCGALSVHNGRHEEAVRFAKRTIRTFERAGVDAVVVNAAGCGSTMKDYGNVLRDEPDGWPERAAAMAGAVRDVSEVLADLGPVAERHPLPVRVAYHDACHLAHGQGVRAQPRALLRAIPDLELVELAEPEICCGSAGVWNLLRPEAAAELGDRKAAHVLAADADLLVTANPGCLMQVDAALRRTGARRLALAHTLDVLDASLRGRSAQSLLRTG